MFISKLTVGGNLASTMGLLFGFSPTNLFHQCVARYFKFVGLQSQLVQLNNGTTMHCWIPQKKQQGTTSHETAGDKPALVLLHAFGLNSHTWARQISSFSASFDLYVPDLLFSGESFTTNKERTEFFQVGLQPANLK